VNYKEFFNKKRVAVIGLGPHGEMLPDIKFLVRNKAMVSLFETRSQSRLKNYSRDLADIGLVASKFGKINPDDLLDFDLILLSPEISRNSFFLKKATDAEKQIEYPETLFFKLSPQITLVGVMGMYGKTAVSNMIYSVLKKSFVDIKDQGLFYIDPDSANGALTHLKKIKSGDVVLVRIIDQLLPYYYKINISPHVAVITSITDFDILSYQTYNNFIIASDEVMDAIRLHKNLPQKAKMIRTRASAIPADWNVPVRSNHDKENLSLVLQTSELFKVNPEVVKDTFQQHVGLKGSVEFIKKVDGKEFYNDANSIHPHSTISAIKTISKNKDTVLIIGGAYTGHDYTDLVKILADYVNTVILLPGSGTLGIRSNIELLEGIRVIQALNIEEAVIEAYNHAGKGDKVLFSPGFDAVGVDISRKERGEKFVKAVRGL
jgi:UDP-N-acetylmuramoylalanine--D-glutamate ligase